MRCQIRLKTEESAQAVGRGSLEALSNSHSAARMEMDFIS
jgi:hypothetical protein